MKESMYQNNIWPIHIEVPKLKPFYFKYIFINMTLIKATSHIAAGVRVFRMVGRALGRTNC